MALGKDGLLRDLNGVLLTDCFINAHDRRNWQDGLRVAKLVPRFGDNVMFSGLDKLQSVSISHEEHPGLRLHLELLVGALGHNFINSRAAEGVICLFYCVFCAKLPENDTKEKLGEERENAHCDLCLV